MKFEFVSLCRAKGLFGGCEPPATPEEVAALADAMPLFKAQGVYSTVLVSPSHPYSLPSGSVRKAAGILAHPDNAKIALIHPRGLYVCFLRVEAIHQAVTSGLFESGQTYHALVNALGTLGYESWDIEIQEESSPPGQQPA